jgi:nucleotide-binding universal stress UspA family protein
MVRGGVGAAAAVALGGGRYAGQFVAVSPRIDALAMLGGVALIAWSGVRRSTLVTVLLDLRVIGEHPVAALAAHSSYVDAEAIVVGARGHGQFGELTIGRVPDNSFTQPHTRDHRRRVIPRSACGQEAVST